MKKAVISLSFDDGRKDNKDVFESILFPMNIPVTLNITTGYVDGSCPEKMKPSDKDALTIEDIQQFSKNPLVELALHGDQHLNTKEDMLICRRKISEWTNQSRAGKRYGIASPGSGLSVQGFIESDDTFFRDEILYLRHSLRIKTKPYIRILARKIGRIVHIPFLFKIAYKDTIMESCPDRVIYAVPVLKDTTVSQLKCLIRQCIKQKGALTLMFHSIVDDVSTEDNWSWKNNKFRELCRFIIEKSNNDVLEVLNTNDLFQLLKQEK